LKKKKKTKDGTIGRWCNIGLTIMALVDVAKLFLITVIIANKRRTIKLLLRVTKRNPLPLLPALMYFVCKRECHKQTRDAC